MVLMRKRDRRVKALVATMTVLLFIFSWGVCATGAEVETEDLVKAAFVYNFLKFVKLPKVKNTIVVGIVGDGGMEKAIEGINGRRVKGRTILVKRCRNPRGMMDCSVVFVTRDYRGDIGGIVALSRKKGILTISDRRGFIDRGGMIGLVRSGSRIGFEVNLGVAKGAGVFVSSRLLKLSLRVIR